MSKPVKRRHSVVRISLLALLAALMVAPVGGAAINDVHDVTTTLPFVEPGGEILPPIISGQVAISGVDENGAAFFGDVERFRMNDIDRVCWLHDGGGCHGEGGGELSLRVENGGTFMIHLRGQIDPTFDADHAVALLIEADQNSVPDPSIPVDQLMALLATNGTVDLGPLPAIPYESEQPEPNRMARMVPLGDSTITLLQGAQPIRTFSNEEVVLFEGRPTAPAFAADVAVMDFRAGKIAHFVPAEIDDAALTLSPEKLNQSAAILGFQMDGLETGGLPEELAGLFHSVLTGAVIEGAGQGFLEKGVVSRYEALTLRGENGGAVADGEGYFVMQEGEVAGSQPLIGFAWFVVPWWSILLWVVAIGAWIAALVTKSPKKVDGWQDKKWIGSILGVLAFIIIIFMWDSEFRTVLGFSWRETGAVDLGSGAIFAIQLGLLGFIMFAVASPLTLLLGSAARLAKQGKIMGLAAPVGAFTGFLIGVSLLPSYIQFLVHKVAASV